MLEAWTGSFTFYAPRPLANSSVKEVVQHALAFAQRRDSPPVLACGIILDWHLHPLHTAVMRHPECTVLASLPAGTCLTDHAVDIVLFHNQAGLDRYLKRDKLGDLRSKLRAVVASSPRGKELGARLHSLPGIWTFRYPAPLLRPPVSAIRRLTSPIFRFFPNTPRETKNERTLSRVQRRSALTCPTAHDAPATPVQATTASVPDCTITGAQQQQPASPPTQVSAAPSAHIIANCPPPPLRFPGPSAAGCFRVYVDSSKPKSTQPCKSSCPVVAQDKTTATGCGVFAPDASACSQIIRFQVTGNVTRGDLLAILWVLQSLHRDPPPGSGPGKDITIFCDNLRALRLIARVLADSSFAKQHAAFGRILEDISSAIAGRRGSVSIMKVRAHSEQHTCVGNKTADRLAREAARAPPSSPLLNATCPVTHSTPSAIEYGDDESRLAGNDTDESEGISVLNPNDSHKKMVLKAAMRAVSAPQSTYLGTAMQASAGTELDIIDSKASFAFLAPFTVPSSTATFALKARYRCLPCKARLYKMRLTPTPRCPFCGAIDGPLHFATVCTHPTLSGSRTNRHNEAVHMLVQYIRKHSKLGDSTILLNAGNGPAGRVQKTVPHWLLPNYPYLPDITILIGWPQHKFDSGRLPTASEFHSITVLHLEFCFANDFHLEEAIAKKRRAYSTDPPDAPNDVDNLFTPPSSPARTPHPRSSPPAAPRKLAPPPPHATQGHQPDGHARAKRSRRRRSPSSPSPTPDESSGGVPPVDDTPPDSPDSPIAPTPPPPAAPVQQADKRHNNRHRPPSNLIRLLREHGRRVLGVVDDSSDDQLVTESGPHIPAIVIGHTGVMHSRSLNAILKAAGLSAKHITTLKNKLNRLAVTRLHDIYNVKNMLDKNRSPT